MKRGKGAYMISAVAEMYGIHPQTLRLYEREGLLKPSRTEGNTRLYTDEDLKRLEFILELARDYGVNISGIDMILHMKDNMEIMRKQMELMQQQMQEFFRYFQTEVMRRAGREPSPNEGALVPFRGPLAAPSEKRAR
jgi:MerR family transcriptional regulator/heat shock protein HspR